MCFVVVMLFISMVLCIILVIYYVKYVFGEVDLVIYFVIIGMIGNIFGCVCVNFLSKWVDKKIVYICL